MNASQRIKETLTRLFLQRYRYFVLAVVIIILGLGYLVVLGPKVSELLDVGVGGFRSQQSTLDERRQYRVRLTEMVDQFTKEVSPADIAFLERAIPFGPQVPNLLSVINDLAQQNGFRVVSASVSEATKTATESGASGDLDAVLRAVRGQGASTTRSTAYVPETLDVRVTLSGPVGYAVVRSLLNAVESSERLFDVQSLNFNVAAAAGGPGDQATRETQYEMSFKTLYVPEPETK